MMTDEKVARINALYKKAKEEGLSDAEKQEQDILRKEYVASVRASLRGNLDNVKVIDPEGNDVTPKRKH